MTVDISKKTILVTGGTGSFGNFIVDRLLKENAKEIRIFSRDEKKQYDMKIHYNHHPSIKFFIGSIRDHLRVDEVIQGVDIVFQAAALKHVAVCEYNPVEAIKTNVLGVKNVISAALRERVEKVITISTDKAVKPVNVMGMTKALQERLILSANLAPDNKGTVLSCVRYGNVMSSRGSVIPFFKDQLRNGEELTITDVEMTRFLLTLEDAVDLVMFALHNSEGGEVFVKKSPSVKVVDLAKVISKNFNTEFKYKVIGKYPGEKIHEILITEEELHRTRDMGAYFKVQPWWEAQALEDLQAEYISSNETIENDQLIRNLIESSDAEMSTVSFEGKEFAKF